MRKLVSAFGAAMVMSVSLLSPSAHADSSPVYQSTWHDKVKVPKFVAGKGPKKVITPARAFTNQRYTVIGRVDGKSARKVKVQLKKGKRWRTVKTLHARKRVHFSTRTGKASTVRHRFVVEKKGRAKKYITATAKTVIKAKPKPQRAAIVQPTPNPTASNWDAPWDEPEWSVMNEPAPGDPGQWSFIYNELQMRWQNCTIITWNYDPKLGYASSTVDIARAFARVSALSKLRFKQVSHGTDALIEVKWGTEQDFPHAAVAGTTYSEGKRVDGKYHIVKSEITLNADQSLEPRLYPSYIGNMAWGQVFHHEINHAVGLAHYPNNSQIMYDYVDKSNYRFGAGDRAGLAAMGSDGPCAAY